jgi:PhnB protein
MAVHWKPNHQQVVPYFVCNNVRDVVEFAEKVFGATVEHQSEMPDGTIMHVSMRLGDSAIMMGTAREPWGPRLVNVYVYVPDVDETYRRALSAGAKSLMEPTTQFYGDRGAGVQDSAGNFWWIGTRVEEVSPEELDRRSREMMAKGGH